VIGGPRFLPLLSSAGREKRAKNDAYSPIANKTVTHDHNNIQPMKHENQTIGDLLKPHEPRKRKAPPRAIVQCDGFRCVGLKKTDGKWIGLSGEELKVLEVLTWVKR